MALMKIKAGPRDRLRVYLNDHLAGAAGAIRLAQRCRGNNAGTPLAAFLDEFLRELHEDYDVLRGLLARLRMPVARPKQAAAVAAEWIARAKLNGQLIGYSPLGRLVELEALCAGVDGKRSLWLSLAEIENDEPEARALDLTDLVRRAEAQRQGLEMHRRAAASAALSRIGAGSSG